MKKFSEIVATICAAPLILVGVMFLLLGVGIVALIDTLQRPFTKCSFDNPFKVLEFELEKTE